jgi:hypothetical protein
MRVVAMPHSAVLPVNAQFDGACPDRLLMLSRRVIHDAISSWQIALQRGVVHWPLPFSGACTVLLRFHEDCREATGGDAQGMSQASMIHGQATLAETCMLQ